MANVTLHNFNRGRISRLGLGRTDLDRVKLSSETQTNWMPRALGSMMLRPGLGYLGSIRNNVECRIVPFVFQSTDTALLELTTTAMRVWIDGSVVTRSSALSTISNGTFSSDLTSWTDADESGATSTWTDAASTGSGYMALYGTRYSRARRRQTVSASSGAQNLSLHIERGPVFLRVGSSTGADDYLSERTLRSGHYSLSIVTTGNYFLELSGNTEYPALVDSVSVESSGHMIVDTPWSSTDLTNLRWSQSNDVVFIACRDVPQKRIERHSTESWAVVDYVANDGPFRNVNVTATRLTPSGLSGEVTVSSDRPFFSQGNAGGLIQITSVGQSVSATFTAPSQASDSIRVSGVGSGRTFTIFISTATSANTILIQRSIGEEGSWQVVGGLGYTSSTSETYTDGLDNQIVFYRLYSPSSASTNTTAAGQLTYSGGGVSGVVRVASAISSTQASCIVLSRLGSTAASELWSEGDWSPLRGYPSAVALHEGRVFWAGKSKLWGSVSDNFESFDADSTDLGDAGPINLNIASGSNETIDWLLSLTRLMMGSPLSEAQAKTSSLEEPLTPTNFALRDISTQGSASVQAVKIDQRAIFVQASQSRIMEIVLGQSQLDYDTIDRSVLIPEIGEPAITRLVVQRQPDTRVHFVRSDGTVAVLLSDPVENILCWLDVETNGVVEESAVLPGAVEDEVFYVVRREVNGSTVRYLEKWALESEARGGPTNKMADSFIVQNSTATTTVSGLDHLVGSSVIAWGSTDDLGSYTVSTTGTITLSAASTTTVVGLPYYGTFVSSKLAYAAPSGGSALTARKKLSHLGVILADTHSQGLRYGPSTDRLQNLPRIERGQSVSTGRVWSDYDNDPVIFPGSWDTDSRLCLLSAAPRPVTVLAAVIGMETREKS